MGSIPSFDGWPLLSPFFMPLASLLNVDEVLWSHRCSAPVGAPRHKLTMEGGQVRWEVWESTAGVGTEDKVAFA